MTSKELIESGLIELYVLGIASSEEQSIVETLMNADDYVKKEIEDISSALNLYSSRLLSEKSILIKENILNHIAVEETGLAPILSKNSKVEEWENYISNLTIVKPIEFEGLCNAFLPGNNSRETFILWGKKDDFLPDEEHEGIYEHLLVLAGSCTITIGEKQVLLNKGDYFVISPNLVHGGMVTSASEMMLLVQRRTS